MFSFLLLASLLSLAFAADPGCYEGAILSSTGAVCYHTGDFRGDFATAEKVCAGFGGHLASVHNKWDMDMLIVSMNIKKFWLGARQVNEIWTWTDGSSYDYSNWADGEPNDGGCVLVDADRFLWSAEDCSTEARFVCETTPFPVTTVAPTTTTTEATTTTVTDTDTFPCPTEPESRFTYILTTQALEWSAAESFCHALKGHLASVHDASTQEQMEKYAASQVNNAVWLGGQVAAGSRNLTWTDGSVDDSETWATENPKNSASATCVIVYKGEQSDEFSVGWNNVDCSRKFPAVCEILTSHN